MCAEACPLDGPNAVVRTDAAHYTDPQILRYTDAASAFQALTNDETLIYHRISIKVSCVKTPNKNPVAEEAIQKLEEEI